MPRYFELFDRLRRRVLEGPGETPQGLRQAVAARAAAPAGLRLDGDAELPALLEPFVEKLALHAYKITDQDVARLLEAGYSQDEIFELSVAGAVGAGLARYRIGLAALAGEGR
ncbi:MAG: hypothetical protein U0002_20210 [Thermoanaerobaculia bacterium]